MHKTAPTLAPSPATGAPWFLEPEDLVATRAESQRSLDSECALTVLRLSQPEEYRKTNLPLLPLLEKRKKVIRTCLGCVRASLEAQVCNLCRGPPGKKSRGY